MSDNPKVFDVRLFTKRDLGEEVWDHNDTCWHVYTGTPVAQYARMLAIQQEASSEMVEKWQTGEEGVPVTVVNQMRDAIWANFKRANAGRTRDEFEDGFDIEEILALFTFLSLRMQLRTGEAASVTTEASPSPAPKTKPARSSKAAL